MVNWDMVIVSFLVTMYKFILEPDPWIQFLENLGEDTKLHDQLHVHHPAGNFFHVIIFCLMSTRSTQVLADLNDFYQAYLLGKYWQSVSYWFIPKEML